MGLITANRSFYSILVSNAWCACAFSKYLLPIWLLKVMYTGESREPNNIIMCSNANSTFANARSVCIRICIDWCAPSRVKIFCIVQHLLDCYQQTILLSIIACSMRDHNHTFVYVEILLRQLRWSNLSNKRLTHHIQIPHSRSFVLS